MSTRRASRLLGEDAERVAELLAGVGRRRQRDVLGAEARRRITGRETLTIGSGKIGGKRS
jgi:hypothetical protein